MANSQPNLRFKIESLRITVVLSTLATQGVSYIWTT